MINTILEVVLRPDHTLSHTTAHKAEHLRHGMSNV